MSPPWSVWRELTEPRHAELVAAAAGCDAHDPAQVQRLRRLADPPLATAALQLAAARRKAAAKFPDHAQTLLADAVGVEQATSRPVADHKAGRFADRGGRVLDLCCGIGGDAMSLHRAGLPVLAVDREPLRAWMCQRNADCDAAAADVTALDLQHSAFHIDPARRNPTRRLHRFADHEPGPAALLHLLRRNPTGAVKLSPAVDLDELSDLGFRGEVEFISEQGRLVQAVLWTGDLQRAPRSAALLTATGAHRVAGEPATPPVAPIRRYIHTADPALERAGLLHTLHLPLVHPALGLLTDDHPHASPWLTPFEVLEHVPYRLNKLKAWLAAHDAGAVEVKTRGRAVDPDPLQRELQRRAVGATPYTLFILRWDRRLMATITRRVSSTQTPGSSNRGR